MKDVHDRRATMIRELADIHGTTALIETGTALGDMIRKVLPSFRRAITIELDPEYHAAAVANLAEHDNVAVWLGDSADLLDCALWELQEHPTLVYLDGHWSGPNTGRSVEHGNTPIRAELAACSQAKNAHVIIVDDARHYGTFDGYPTVDEIEEWAGANNYTIHEYDDALIMEVTR